jgi:glycosyltransferase involved in cell wall biosynthesis
LKPAISVVLPTYNGEPFVAEAVESVLRQDTDDFELVICDDASSDSTWETLSRYTDPRIKLLRNPENRGLFPTLNRLMHEARGRWIHLWSQDDRMLPDCLSGTLQFASDHADVGMIYSGFFVIDELGDRARAQTPPDETPEIVDTLLAARILFYKGSISGNIANVTLRKDVFDAVGDFREDLQVSGDYEYWTRLSGSWKIGFDRKRLIELRAHPGQLSRHPTSGGKFIRENRRIREALIERLPAEERKRATSFRRWFLEVKDFHHSLHCLRERRVGEAAGIFGQLREDDYLVATAARWLISRNGRWLPDGARPV